MFSDYFFRSVFLIKNHNWFWNINLNTKNKQKCC